MPFFDPIRIGSSGSVDDYEIERSLRFNDDDTAYLNRTPSSAGNRKTFTISFWIKRANLGDVRLIACHSGNSDTGNFELDFVNDTFRYIGWSTQFRITNRKFRDPSAWYHIVTAIDTTDSTADDRIKIYVNGVQETSFSSSSNPSQDFDTGFNQASTTRIGLAANSISGPFDGYMAEINFIDGQALTPSSFGETNAATGQWVPINTSGLTFGTNGFRLKFSDNSGTTATTLGKDSSGNGNNFTPSNFSVSAGKDDDSMFDTPTNNFPTLSPLDKSLVGTMSNGNLRISYNYKPASKTFRSTMALPSTGKIYWEWENEETTAGRWQTGLVRYTNEAGVVDFQGYNDADYLSVSFGGSMWNGTTHINPAWSSYPTFYSGERVAFAIDCSNGKVWIGKVASNGSTTWYDDDGTTDGDPAGGTNETCTLASFTTATEWMPVVMWHDGGAASSTTYTSNINFGNHSFLGTVPTGFGKLCSANLPDPTILLPNNHFDTLLYTGNGSTTQNITGYNFQPDWVWIKSRSSGSGHHSLVDSVRGDIALNSNQTIAEYSVGDFNFNATSIDVPYFANDYSMNTNSATYVAWNWNAGGSTVTNNDGSVASQVRANTSAGFSIVTFSGSGNRTIGHGLGVAPQVIIMKGRNVSDQWTVGHHKLDASNPWHKGIPLNTNATTQDNDTFWNDTAPTSTVFSKGTWDDGYNMVAYCFSEVAGYSKFGSYTGNGSTDGTFVYTGFRPAWIMIKNTDTTGWWFMYDVKRETYNPQRTIFGANVSDAEYYDNAYKIDILSNGFKARGTQPEINKSGSPIIYLAFAESPFKYSRAR